MKAAPVPIRSVIWPSMVRNDVAVLLVGWQIRGMWTTNAVLVSRAAPPDTWLRRILTEAH